jgi:hypothetical protein
VKAFLARIFNFVTDSNGDGDIVKLGGAILMGIALVRFAAVGTFDAVAFGSGAAAATAGKALDAVIPKAES